MVGGYFYDMRVVLEGLQEQLAPEGETWAVVGDSQYAGILVPTADILAELAPAMGYRVVNVESFRSMRASAQQGGQEKLDETLIILRKS
jgi:phosphoketolase